MCRPWAYGGFEGLTRTFFGDFYSLYDLGQYITYVHTVYWGFTLLALLASLTLTARRASSPVARRRATVRVGFAAGFLIPVGGESAALLFHVNLPLEFLWVPALFPPPLSHLCHVALQPVRSECDVRRTLTYTVLTGMVIGAYLLLIWIFDTLLQDIPVSQARGFPVLFGLGVLFVLNPLRQRVQSALDRAFFRTRYDFRQTIETLSQDLTALLDLDEIAQRLVKTVTSALHVASAALYLDDGSGAYRPVAVVGEAAERLAASATGGTMP